MSGPIWTLEEIGPRLDEFLKPVLRAARLRVEFEVEPAALDTDVISPDYIVNFHGDDVDLLLEQRAELLLAIEHLALEALRAPHEDRYRLIFDAGDYRLMRIEELRVSAQTAAEHVKKTGVPYEFGPMTSRERRVIHVALRDDPDVETTSEGVAPRRYTVVRAMAAKR